MKFEIERFVEHAMGKNSSVLWEVFADDESLTFFERKKDAKLAVELLKSGTITPEKSLQRQLWDLGHEVKGIW